MPTFYRNTIVFANNKRQNIEYRLFAKPNGTLNTCSVAIGFSSYYSKLDSDRNNVSLNIVPNYFLSQSVATGSAISYQNDKPIFSEIFNTLFLEYASTGSFNESSSFTNIFYTNYYVSESVSTGLTINYQNNRPVYSELLDNLTVEYASTGSFVESSLISNTFTTAYYISESNATGSTINYQNNKPTYSELLDNLTVEYASTGSFNESSSFTNIFYTTYYISESNATGSTISYQNSKYVILEDYSYLLIE